MQASGLILRAMRTSSANSRSATSRGKEQGTRGASSQTMRNYCMSNGFTEEHVSCYRRSFYAGLLIVLYTVYIQAPQNYDTSHEVPKQGAPPKQNKKAFTPGRGEGME